MSNKVFDLIVIGASAGGLDALLTLVRGLPRDFAGSLVVVVHAPSGREGLLPQILSRATELRVRFAEHGDRIEAGRILVAPGDFHTLISDRGIVLGRGPQENGFRPAIDPLCRSAARVYGRRVMGVILSGALDDGAYGMKRIRDSGGTTVVQDPDEAAVPGMPLSVLRTTAVDHVLRAADIAMLIAGSADAGLGEQPASESAPEPEPQDPRQVTTIQTMLGSLGAPTALSCPACGGSLWEIEDGKLTRYRCHVGHQYSADSLDSQQTEVVEGALWSALRILEEHAELRGRMARRADAGGFNETAARFQRSSEEVHRQAGAIRTLLFGRTEHQPESEGEDLPRPVAPRSPFPSH